MNNGIVVNGVGAAFAQWNMKAFRIDKKKTSSIVAFIIDEGNLHSLFCTVGVKINVLPQRLASTQFHFIATGPKSAEAFDEIFPANYTF
mmetsp:Transcript_22078/g.30795  ORF Transcript_22078/g.30795 Transcript_22078/m.30795 type:complete len:89 (-) Transcript_22078:135-401(-)